MKKLLIAALTVLLLPAFLQNTMAKNARNIKSEKVAFTVEPTSFSAQLENFSKNVDDLTTVEVDYIIDENGKAVITYINSENERAKNVVIEFIENTTHNVNIFPGKIFSMKLNLNK